MPNTVPEMVAQPVYVAVGVVFNHDGQVLVTRRPKHVHQGGLWEFPGGKREAGETCLEALTRELTEEVDITVLAAMPLIKIQHDYGDCQVVLDVWRVTSFSGTACPCEGQEMCWVPIARLTEMAFPVANLNIIKALALPNYYAILEGKTVTEVMSNAEHVLQRGIKLLQLRAKSLLTSEIADLLAVLTVQCQQHQVKLLINSDLAMIERVGDGIHLTSRALSELKGRPPGYDWVAASCHNLAELQLAERIGVDFAVLAAVQPTATHPGQFAIGWDNFEDWVDQVNIPVYAMGGLALTDLDKALMAGAQGIAGISAFVA